LKFELKKTAAGCLFVCGVKLLCNIYKKKMQLKFEMKKAVVVVVVLVVSLIYEIWWPFNRT